MNGIHYAVRRIHNGENDIHKLLLALAEQHHAEHELHHVARDLAAWSADHVHRLAEHASKLNLDLDDDPRVPKAVTERSRATASTLIGRRVEPGLLLLDDLRDLHLQASDNSLGWEMLAQIAQAEHQRELLTLTQQCHGRNLRQLRWTNTLIKTQAPQVLAGL
jgi:hypothetical protein